MLQQFSLKYGSFPSVIKYLGFVEGADDKAIKIFIGMQLNRLHKQRYILWKKMA